MTLLYGSFILNYIKQMIYKLKLSSSFILLSFTASYIL